MEKKQPTFKEFQEWTPRRRQAFMQSETTKGMKHDIRIPLFTAYSDFGVFTYFDKNGKAIRVEVMTEIDKIFYHLHQFSEMNKQLYSSRKYFEITFR